ncbi:hypothetical protein DSO57_1003146 [Entomophthora muscae]|uniref:Uncharacterized protein n=1 Tax=Entomophthora muscae TaxID=34485 RepID=A0ACC2RNI3_9FUNG|nr:hypothetical protein DSO57_1003146 [Entomophthora muscae]
MSDTTPNLMIYQLVCQHKANSISELSTEKVLTSGSKLLIDNSSSLETQAREQESNPDPRPPRAAGPVDQRTARPRFAGIEPPQADIKNIGPCSETGQTKEIISPNGRLITVPNRGMKVATISFMNLKSTPVANQEPSPERGMGLQPDLMTTTLKKVNQVANLRFLINERTPGPSAILLPLDLSTQSPQACLTQCPDESPMENIKFRGGVLYRPKDPLLPYIVFAFYQISTRFSGPPVPLPAVFCPPGAPFGPIHFTDYPLKSEYKDYTPEKILKLDTLARIQSAIRYNHQGLWIFSTPKLFRGKFNYLPAYNIHMKLPVTSKPMPASLPDLPTDHTGKLFGIVYITLTGVIDTIIPVASP